MGARALRLFAAGVCRSSKVGLVDAAQEVVSGNAIGFAERIQDGCA